MRAASLPAGARTVCPADIEQHRDVPQQNYRLYYPKGDSDQYTSDTVISMYALLRFALGPDAADQVQSLEMPRSSGNGTATLYRDELRKTDDPRYAYGSEPPPAVYVNGKGSDAEIYYLRSRTGPGDLNGLDLSNFSAGESLELTVDVSPHSDLDPELTADKTSVPHGGSVRFTASLDHPPAHASYHWDFGDGSTTDTSTPQVVHAFPDGGGTFVATAKVSSPGDGPRGTSNQVSIRVGKKPTAPATNGPGGHGTSPHKHTLPNGPDKSRGTQGGAAPSSQPGAGNGTPAPARGSNGGDRPGGSPEREKPGSSSSPPASSRAPSETTVAADLPTVDGQLLSATFEPASRPSRAGRVTAPANARPVLTHRQVPWTVLVVAGLLALGALSESTVPGRIREQVARRVARTSR